MKKCINTYEAWINNLVYMQGLKKEKKKRKSHETDSNYFSSYEKKRSQFSKNLPFSFELPLRNFKNWFREFQHHTTYKSLINVLKSLEKELQVVAIYI